MNSCILLIIMFSKLQIIKKNIMKYLLRLKIKIVNIYEGYRNLLLKKLPLKTTTKAKKCLSCKFLDSKWYYGPINDKDFPSLSGKSCKVCGCNLSAKIRSNSKCPLNLF